MRLSLIVAMSRNRVIGDHGRLPWSLPADLARFKDLTMGHTVIMGRQTYESLGRPLPGRTNVVLSRSGKFDPADGVEVCDSLAAAIRQHEADDEVFVIGGQEVYRQALPIADRIYLTLVDRDYEGDAVFPEYDRSCFVQTEHSNYNTPIPHRFEVLDRVSSGD